MKSLEWYLLLILAGICLIMGPVSVSAEDEPLVSLLDRISQRINSYPENKNYQVEVLTRIIEMNKQWEPEKTTIIKAIGKAINGEEDSEILAATETQDGKTSDITEKITKQAEKQKEKARHDAEKKADGKETKNPLTEFFPFDETKRSEFDFHRLDDGVIDGKDVFIIESAAKTKDAERLEGKYYIDQETLDIVKIDVKPSKNPMFVNNVGMEIDFKVLPEGYYVMKKMKAKVDAKIVFKSIRQISETEYQNYEILHPDTK